jgi:hypothetical protein
LGSLRLGSGASRLRTEGHAQRQEGLRRPIPHARQRLYLAALHDRPHVVYTPEGARERARKVRQTVRDGIDPTLLKKQERPNTIEKLIQGFIQSRRRKGRRAADEIHRVLDREIGNAWRGRSVASITKPDIHHVLDAIMDRGSSVIANRTLAHLKTMFNWGEEPGHHHTLPCGQH